VISSLTALFIIFAAVIGSTMMMGVFAYFLHRIRQIEAGTTAEGGSPGLAREVSELREELAAVEEAFSALSERLDFTERLLMKGDETDPSDDSE
jgi:uncharacterized membrane protein AbrB (regulator of aidB expression)